jgi:hypothetical protein
MKVVKFYGQSCDNRGMKISAAPMTIQLDLAPSSRTIWFAPRCCVVIRGSERDVLVGGILVGTVGRRDTGLRNLLLVGLAKDPEVHLGELAHAFGLSSEAVRLIRRTFETEGISAVLDRRYRGSKPDRRASVEEQARGLFDEKMTVDQVHALVKPKVGRTTVVRIRKDWAREKAAKVIDLPEALPSAPAMADAEAFASCDSEGVPQQSNTATPTEVPVAPKPGPTGDLAPRDHDAGAGFDEASGLRPCTPKSAGLVQHVGAWLLLTQVRGMGLHERASAAAEGRVSAGGLRLALDAVVIALALGERCVEGVRRLATSSVSSLLLASRAPSPTWVRRTLARFAQDDGGPLLHLTMARGYLETARAEAAAEGPVFYVDNHLRPYTGKHVVRKGWRMQDKRVRPGATDYYVHDEDGRPVMRFTAPHHGSLTDFLTPIAATLGLALPEDTVLLAFDRAGTFPEQMAELRDGGTEFVTYERRPFAVLPESAFTETFVTGDEQVRWCEPRRKNLGRGRGRVRRICVRTDEGRQLNLLAVSSRPAPRLIEVMRGRWRQENGFKHGNERWGINHLDGRTVVPYAPGTIIPNPARRRLDHALRIWRVREGEARRKLARLPPGAARRKDAELELEEALVEQRNLEALRPTVPSHAPLRDTELAGKLVHHELEYKVALDTIRVACANAESELATHLAPLLPRPAEAKKTLANLFAAPGRIHVGDNAITVTLRPAGTIHEMNAVTAFLAAINQSRPTLPGDQKGRPVRFRVDQVS